MTTLTFQNTTLSVINKNNQTFLTGSDLGIALGYSKPLQSVTNLYNSNADEFTAEMTALVEMQTAGGIQKVRIFSLRGAHLIAMFARTKIAKEFRKWVLDVLDKEVRKTTALLPNTITPEQQQAIQSAVQQAHHRTGLSYAEIYRQIKSIFKVAKYDQLPAEHFNHVINFLETLGVPVAPTGSHNLVSGNITLPADLFSAIMQHTRLARRLADKVEPFHRHLHEMMGIDRWYKNDIAAIAHDVRVEFNYWLDEGEKIIECYRRAQSERNYATARLSPKPFKF